MPLIRRLQPSDREALFGFFTELSSESYFRPHDFTYATASSVCSATSDYYCGAFSEDALCAYGLLRWGAFENPSLGIAVRKSFRGHGLGRELMHHLHKKAQSRRAVKIRLRVHTDNVAAVDLYKKLGYAFDGEVDRGELVGWYVFP